MILMSPNLLEIIERIYISVLSSEIMTISFFSSENPEAMPIIKNFNVSLCLLSMWIV